MKLTIKERLMLLSVLPAQGDITTLRIVRELRERLSFTEEEHREFGVKQDASGFVTWDNERGRTVEIPIGEKATDVIVAALKRASGANKLTVDMIDLYDRFIIG